MATLAPRAILSVTLAVLQLRATKEKVQDVPPPAGATEVLVARDFTILQMEKIGRD
jgi:hypothetical protein